MFSGKNGAAKQIRTVDPFLTMEVLYRLSYGGPKGAARVEKTPWLAQLESEPVSPEADTRAANRLQSA